MSEVRYIAIEGPIGAGKTTLAKKLSADLAARLVLEQFEDNPFLQQFYDAPDQFAFQTQMFFLLSRYKQQLGLNELDLFHERIISDYTFQKDEIFAQLTLSAAEFGLYRQFAESLESNLARPDVIVYLQNDTERLLKHIRKRGRSYESSINAEYLQQIHEAYIDMFWRRRDLTVLIVDCSNVDFVDNDVHYILLRDRILRPLDPGVHYFVADRRLFD